MSVNLQLPKCSICERPFKGHTHNAEPFFGRCCMDCNARYVVPVRIMYGRNPKPIEPLLRMIRVVTNMYPAALVDAMAQVVTRGIEFREQQMASLRISEAGSEADATQV